MKIQTKSSTGFEKVRVEEGWKNAEFISAKEIPAKTYPGQDKPTERVVLNFSVDDKIVGFVGCIPATPKNKLGVALQALGANLDNGELDLETLKGKMCKVLISNYKDADGDIVSSIEKCKEIVEEESL